MLNQNIKQVSLVDYTNIFNNARKQCGLPALADPSYRIVQVREGMLVSCGCTVKSASNGVVLIDHINPCYHAGKNERIEIGNKHNLCVSIYGIRGIAVWNPYNGLFPDDELLH
jgi:hypothetical protein